MKKKQNLKEAKEKINRYFCESFKISKVKEIEKNLTTISEISNEYDVGRTSVYRWIYKYSHNIKKSVKQVVELKSDKKKLLYYQQKIKDLEQIIGQKQIMIEFQDKMIELAEKEYNVDKKKLKL